MTSLPSNGASREALGDRLIASLGHGAVRTGEAVSAFETDWRGHFRGEAAFVVSPRTSREVSEVVRICAEAGAAIVPQGGRTGLTGGAIPGPGKAAVVVDLSRMAQVRAFDPAGMTLAVDAGMPLGAARAFAAENGLCLPVLIGSEGSAQIGGIVATNAGGSNVLRYGMTRNLVLGLEVVLPDGEIWNGMRAVSKDNAGYALRHLFAGAEGTLGIVTGAVLQLSPAPRSNTTAFCPVPGIASALDLMIELRRNLPAALVAFEYLNAAATAMVAGARADLAAELSVAPAIGDCVLIECEDFGESGSVKDRLHEILGSALERNQLSDAILAANEKQRARIWAFREAISFAQNEVGYSIKNDLSVPISRVPDLLREGARIVDRISRGAVPVCYGHLGDGNIHFNVSPPDPAQSEALRERETEINDALFDLAESLGGSFSAEHGIGQSKPEALARLRAGPEIELMRKIKLAIDPTGIMNPGKLL